jgi:acyl carrier protein
MSIESDLQQFIANEIVLEKAEGGINSDEPLISSGRVDSIGLLQVLGFIHERYGVDLFSSGSPRDFETVEAMASAIRRNVPSG